MMVGNRTWRLFGKTLKYELGVFQAAWSDNLSHANFLSLSFVFCFGETDDTLIFIAPFILTFTAISGLGLCWVLGWEMGWEIGRREAGQE